MFQKQKTQLCAAFCYGVPAGNRTQIGRLGGNSFIQLNYGDPGLGREPKAAGIITKQTLKARLDAQYTQSDQWVIPEWPDH